MGLSESIGKTNMGEDMAEAQACSRNNVCRMSCDYVEPRSIYPLN